MPAPDGPSRSLHAALWAALDASVVGHDRAKLAILLALIAERSVLIVGPDGVGKSTLARAAAGLLSGGVEPRGDAQVHGREIVEHLTLAVGQSDRTDGQPPTVRISRRAPRAADRDLPLLVDAVDGATHETQARLCAELDRGRWAIATAARVADLSPALRDRWVLRSVMQGLAGTRAAARLLARDAPPAGAAAASIEAARGALERARHGARGVLVPIPLLERVAALARRAPSASDRRWSVAPAVLRAAAALRGAALATEADVAALAVVGLLPEEALQLEPGAQKRVRSLPKPSSDPVLPAAPAARGESDRFGGGAAARDVVAARPEIREVELPRTPAPVVRSTQRPAPAVTALLRALDGALEGGAARRRDDPSGAPRRLGVLRDLSEWESADPAEWLRFADGELGDVPRVLRRQRASLGASFVVLRDVSASMEGGRAAFGAQVIEGLVGAVARRRMRVGYLEFNHDVDVFLRRGRLLHRDYAALRARRPCTRGHTNYAAPLRAALDRLPRSSGAAGAVHLLFLTDGLPVLGDPLVREARVRAAASGIVVHTLFIGYGGPPPVLAALARDTGGLAFQARPRSSGRAVLVPIAAGAPTHAVAARSA